ncbi:MAG: hypothetical protein PF443_14740 [Allgaiera sp.]|nr:hypothetical protein [Allgaiera sp.]
MFKRVLWLQAICVVAALSACKADNASVSISDSDLSQAMAGRAVYVPFRARFSIPSTLDAEQRSEINQIKQLIAGFMQIDSVEIQRGDFSSSIVLTGKLPLAREGQYVAAPWYLAIGTPQEGGFVPLILSKGAKFAAMSGAVSNVSSLYAPDASQPLTFQLHLDGKYSVLVPAGWIQGVPQVHTLLPSVTDTSVEVRGGVFDDAGAEILLRPNAATPAPVPPTAAKPSPPQSASVRPSFNCKEASRPDEKAICSSPTLSRMDSKLASLFVRAKHAARQSERTALVRSEVRWLRARHNCGDVLSCLFQIYDSRISQLEVMTGASGQ